MTDWKTRSFRVGLAYALRSFYAECGDNDDAEIVYEKVLQQEVPLNGEYRMLVDRFAFYWQELRFPYHDDAYGEALEYWFGIEPESNS